MVEKGREDEGERLIGKGGGDGANGNTDQRGFRVVKALRVFVCKKRGSPVAYARCTYRPLAPAFLRHFPLSRPALKVDG